MNDISLDALVRELQCLETKCPITKIDSKGNNEWVFKLDFKNVDIEILLTLPPLFPHTHPKYTIHNTPENWKLHIEGDNRICYMDNALWVDYHNPLEILLQTFNLMVDVLEKNDRGDYAQTYANEFESYWNNHPNIEMFNCFIEASDKVSRVIVKESQKGGKEKQNVVSIISHDMDSQYENKVTNCVTILNGLYIPLKWNNDIAIFLKHIEAWNWDDIRTYIWSNLEEIEKKALKKLTKQKVKKSEYLAFSFKRPDGGYAFWGIRCKTKDQVHPLDEKAFVDKITPLYAQRLDKQYLKPRGGVKLLGDAKIMLIGCGSVGSSIANELVKLGISKITLVDKDYITSSNTYRHLTGKAFINSYKAFATKTFLDYYFPYLQLEAHNQSIEDLIIDGKVNLHDFDIILCAIDHLNTSLWLNSYIYTEGIQTPCIYSWLEVLDVGCHAVLTNMPESEGCLECLFYDSDQRFTDQLSFCEEGQSVSKSLSGCADLFIPYGSLEAQKTALLAVETAYKVLNGGYKENICISIKGVSEDFEKNGFKHSTRFLKTSPNNILLNGREFANTICRLCNKKNEHDFSEK